MYDTLQTNSKKPLYTGCKNSLTLLSAMLRPDTGGVTKALVHCFKLCTICFQRKTLCLKVTIRQKRYCVRWVWSIRRFMFSRMIAYYIDMNFKKCKYALSVGCHGTKSRMMMSVVVTETQRRASQWRCCGIFRSFQGLSICLLIKTMQKTFHDMQMGETAMEYSIIRMIPPSGRT